MQLPAETSSSRVRVRYGRYVQGKLRRAKLGELGAAVRDITDRVKAAARAAEDQDEEETLARADRDGVDETTDDHVQDARNQLAGRSVAAAREAPVTLIFAEGVDYYTAAPLDVWDERMSVFAARIAKHLPADDTLCVAVLPLIAADRRDFEAAVAAVATQRTRSTLAGDELVSATEAWERQIEKTYGALVERFGKRNAERFFPRTRRESPEEPPATPVT